MCTNQIDGYDEMNRGEWFTLAIMNGNDFRYINPNEYEHVPEDDRYTFKKIEDAIEFRSGLDCQEGIVIMKETISILDI